MNGRQVDLLAELGGRHVIGFEVKASAAPTAKDARHLARLRDHLGDRFVAGIVLRTGPAAFQLDRKVQAAPIAALWS